MAALLGHIATSPELCRIAFVEIFALGPAGIERRERQLGRYTNQLISGLPHPCAPSRVGLEASVGAVWGILHHYITQGAAHVLPGLAPHATYLALAPVIGGEAAAELILRHERP